MIAIDIKQDRQRYAEAYDRWLKRNKAIGKAISAADRKQLDEFISKQVKQLNLRKEAEALRFHITGTQPAITDTPMKTKKTKKSIAVYTVEELQSARDQAWHDGILRGKADGVKEAQAKYNLQNTMLEAVKQQTAAMESLTRLVTAITDLPMR